MIYKLVASSRSRATEVYLGEDGSLVEVKYYKSGTKELTPVEGINPSLTVRYEGEAQEEWERDAVTAPELAPALRT